MDASKTRTQMINDDCVLVLIAHFNIFIHYSPSKPSPGELPIEGKNKTSPRFNLYIFFSGETSNVAGRASHSMFRSRGVS